MIRGKCNCGKPAISEWLIQHKGIATTMVYCDKCKPKAEKPRLIKIYGK